MGRRCAYATPSLVDGKPADVSAQPVSSAVGKRPRQSERRFLVQNVVAPSPHAVLHDLIRLRAGISARGAAVAAGGGDDADSGTLFGRLGPRTTADGTCGGPSHCSAGTASR